MSLIFSNLDFVFKSKFIGYTNISKILNDFEYTSIKNSERANSNEGVYFKLKLFALVNNNLALGLITGTRIRISFLSTNSRLNIHKGGIDSQNHIVKFSEFGLALFLAE